MLKITAATGARSDWGLFSPVLKALRGDPAFDLRLTLTGQHLMADNGGSLAAIENEGFVIGGRVDMGLSGDDSILAVTKALGRAVAGFGEEFAAHRPDLLLVVGDRYETLGAVQAALIARVPVAHIYGGDVTEGAMDDAMRHAITKMAHLHFVTNAQAEARVIRMGEDPAHVYCVGSPGLDHIRTMQEMSRGEFFESIGFAPRARNVIVTFHPVTLEKDSLSQCRAMLAALERLGDDIGLIFTGSNADPQGREITAMVRAFAGNHSNACFHESLGTLRYLNALRHVDAMVGNSSSGLYEAPSFGLPAVNIGDRQKGRLKAESVIDCAPEEEAIFKAMQEAFKRGRCKAENPYGDGRSAARIVEILKNIENPQSLCRKAFYDVKK